MFGKVSENTMLNVVAKWARPYDGYIVGGSVADLYYGKEFKDIDLLISYASFQKLRDDNKALIDEFKCFESYGSLDEMSIYKGEVAGIDLDIIVDCRSHELVLGPFLVEDYMLHNFDQTIKACYFNPHIMQPVYLPVFRASDQCKTIYPLPTGLIENEAIERAEKAAEKYGLRVSDLYNFSPARIEANEVYYKLNGSGCIVGGLQSQLDLYRAGCITPEELLVYKSNMDCEDQIPEQEDWQ